MVTRCVGVTAWKLYHGTTPGPDEPSSVSVRHIPHTTAAVLEYARTTHGIGAHCGEPRWLDAMGACASFLRPTDGTRRRYDWVTVPQAEGLFDEIRSHAKSLVAAVGQVQ